MGELRRGLVWKIGAVWPVSHGYARSGMASIGMGSRTRPARRGKVDRGLASKCLVCFVRAWPGKAGKARFAMSRCGFARCGSVRRGWPGMAGMVRLGLDW